MYRPCFPAYLMATFAILTYILFCYRNITSLLEEVNTNAVELHISQNNQQKHGFTVNMY